MKAKQLDMNNLPKGIPKWLRAYISPVVFKGEIPIAQVGEDKASLQSIELDGNGSFLLHYRSILCTSAMKVDRIDYKKFGVIPLEKKDQYHAISGDTTTPTLRARLKILK